MRIDNNLSLYNQNPYSNLSFGFKVNLSKLRAPAVTRSELYSQARRTGLPRSKRKEYRQQLLKMHLDTYNKILKTAQGVISDKPDGKIQKLMALPKMRKAKKTVKRTARSIDYLNKIKV